MEIAQKTNRDDQVLRVSNVKKDSFSIFVRSGVFQGSGMIYHYVPSAIDDFIDALAKLEASMQEGVAKLIDVEDNELSFAKDKLGSVEVSGRIVPHTFPHQELQFGFITDQTCLSLFVADLRKARTAS